MDVAGRTLLDDVEMLLVKLLKTDVSAVYSHLSRGQGAYIHFV